MMAIRRILIAAALAALPLMLAGCSCEDSGAGAEGRVVVAGEQEAERARAEQAAAQQAAAEAARAAPAEAEPAERPSGRGERILTAPVDYLHTVTVTAPRHAKKQVSTIKLQSEIKQHYALEGRYPASLAELETWRGEALPEAPAGFEYKYDPKTGTVEVVEAR